MREEKRGEGGAEESADEGVGTGRGGEGGEVGVGCCGVEEVGEGSGEVEEAVVALQRRRSQHVAGTVWAWACGPTRGLTSRR